MKHTNIAHLSLIPLCISLMLTAEDTQTDTTRASTIQRRIYRQQNAKTVRKAATNFEYGYPILPQPTNGDESLYADKRGSYGKGLVQLPSGLVDPAAFNTLTHAFQTGNPSDFNLIALGTNPVQKKLHSPQAGLSYNIMGADSWIFSIPAAPCLTSANRAGEMVELYWQALLRDIPFATYGNDELSQVALEDLNELSDFKGPKIDGQVTSQTLFRSGFPGTLTGPYISQFLYHSVPFSDTNFLQRYNVPTNSYLNYFMTTIEKWSAQQQGYFPTDSIQFDPTARYIRNGRDLGNFVHNDPPQLPYIYALCIINSFGNAAYDQSNPYIGNPTQQQFAELYKPQFVSLLSYAVDMALHAAWYQKWCVHRTLRPESYAYLVHQQLSGIVNYGLNSDVLNSLAVQYIYNLNSAVNDAPGTYLLPQAYPEGCPLHPSYPAGHATVAGAAVTMLKAFFNENFVIQNPVVPNEDGTELVPYEGDPLTIGGELNKLGSNIAIGRNFAGVHYRSDAYESMLLGEQVAIHILEEMAYTWNINFQNGFSLTKFDGTVIRVGGKKQLQLLPS